MKTDFMKFKETFKLAFIDLDNTLYPESLYLYNLIREFDSKVKINRNQNKLFNNRYLENSLNRRSKDIITEIFKIYYDRSPTFIEHEILFYFYKNLDSDLRLYEGAIELLDFLKCKNIKLILLSNGIREVQLNKLRLLKISNYLDHIEILSKKEFQKPNPESALNLVKKYGLGLDEVVIIGDDPKTDILLAKNAGITAIRVKTGFFRNEKVNELYDKIYEFDNINNLFQSLTKIL
jgi:HAD superfamily hydrolase (TIGR01549 family)